MSFDVLVIGGGIVGTSVARAIARAGGRVAIVERDEVCSHASWAAAGMLAPHAEAEGPGPFLELLIRARELFPELSRELKVETGLDIAYRTEGTLLLASALEEEIRLESIREWQAQAGFSFEWLEREEAHRREPVLGPNVHAALVLPGDHQVDNRLLCRALWDSALLAGATVEIGQVQRITSGRPMRIELADGRQLQAGRIVVAAGAWSATLAGLPHPLPIEPVHGQLVALAAGPVRLGHTLISPHGYLVPRLDGRVIAGATVERTGFRMAVTAQGVQRVLANALAIAPALGDRPIASSWSGLRPATPDFLPILGPDPRMPGVLYATGHYRNGILLGPLTGAVIGALALGLEPEFDLEPFGIERFRS